MKREDVSLAHTELCDGSRVSFDPFTGCGVPPVHEDRLEAACKGTEAS